MFVLVTESSSDSTLSYRWFIYNIHTCIYVLMIIYVLTKRSIDRLIENSHTSIWSIDRLVDLLDRLIFDS